MQLGRFYELPEVFYIRFFQMMIVLKGARLPSCSVLFYFLVGYITYSGGGEENIPKMAEESVRWYAVDNWWANAPSLGRWSRA